MAEVDYYQILGVAPTATAGEIRKAYRLLARRVHPDTNPEWEDDVQANQWMAALNQAYDVLSDPFRRAAYDQSRQERPGQNGEPIRYYETPGFATATARQARPHEASERPASGSRVVWPVRTFARPKRQLATQLAVSILAVALTVGIMLVSRYIVSLDVLMVGLAVEVFGLAFSGACMLGVALQLGGYTELGEDCLIQRAGWGLPLVRRFPYSTIRRVWGKIVRIGPVTLRYVIARCIGQNKYGTKGFFIARLAPVADHDAFLRELSNRTSGRLMADASSSRGVFASLGFGAALIWAGLIGAVVFADVLAGSAFTPIWWDSLLCIGGVSALHLCAMFVLAL
jgi:hypothetical protein